MTKTKNIRPNPLKPVTVESTVNSMPDDEIQRYIILKTANADKLSCRAKGQLTYSISYSKVDNALYVQLLSNDTGGYFSLERVPYTKIAECLEPFIQANKAFSATIFRPAFVSPSQNNSGFLAAVLKAEGLLIATPHLHLLQVDVNALKKWSSELLQHVSQPSSDEPSEDTAIINRVMHHAE